MTNPTPDKQSGQLPTTGGMFFEGYVFDPESNITLNEIALLLKTLQITFGRDVFGKLPDRMKRHFIRHTRDGKSERWSRRSK